MTNKEISIQITRYLKGELSEEEEDQLWIEFLKDKQRFRQFETELNLYDLFQNKDFSLSKLNNRIEEPQNNYRGWFYSAAAAILLLSGFYFFNIQNKPPESLAISEIEISEMLGSDIYRDDRSEPTLIDQKINQSIASALAGELRVAYDILDDLRAESFTNHQALKLEYNKGILAYNSGQYEQSANHFSKLRSLDDVPDYMYESASWFEVNSYLKLQDHEKSIPLLQEIIKINETHKENAEMLLKKIEERR